ncbi:MAG: ornithine cyclodeaminase family protein [Gemmatimonadota bacterium]
MSTDGATLLVPHHQVDRLLPMADCIGLMAETLAALSRGEALLPLRTVIRLSGGRNAFAAMPAVLGRSIGAKVISVFPDNEGTPWDSHIGVVLYFDDLHGRLLAIIDASRVTAIRTAAVSGVATRFLALPGADDLAILGSGTQARTHLDAMLAVRPVSRLRIWSRSAGNRERFASQARSSHPSLHITVCDNAEAAVRDASIVCTTTSSRDPILHGAWITPGAHVNVIGASLPTAREVDTAAVVRSRFFVDRRESVLAEGGAFLMARAEGAVGDEHIIGELGELVLGTIRGRTSDRDVTMFKSVGLAVEDVACARFIHQRAIEAGDGQWINLCPVAGSPRETVVS